MKRTVTQIPAEGCWITSGDEGSLLQDAVRLTKVGKNRDEEIVFIAGTDGERQSRARTLRLAADLAEEMVDPKERRNPEQPATPAFKCWLCEKPCEPHAFYLAPDNETAQAICEPCGEENTTDTCGCCGAKGDHVQINELIEVTDHSRPAPTYIAMCDKCEVESERLSRELDQE